MTKKQTLADYPEVAAHRGRLHSLHDERAAAVQRIVELEAEAGPEAMAPDVAELLGDSGHVAQLRELAERREAVRTLDTAIEIQRRRVAEAERAALPAIVASWAPEHHAHCRAVAEAVESLLAALEAEAAWVDACRREAGVPASSWPAVGRAAAMRRLPYQLTDYRHWIEQHATEEPQPRARRSRQPQPA